MALANETRLHLMLALIENADESELCVCDLARIAGASPSMTSHQLRILREAGLVTFRRQGKRILYRCAASYVSHLLLDARQHVEVRTAAHDDESAGASRDGTGRASAELAG